MAAYRTAIAAAQILVNCAAFDESRAIFGKSRSALTIGLGLAIVSELVYVIEFVYFTCNAVPLLCHWSLLLAYILFLVLFGNNLYDYI